MSTHENDYQRSTVALERAATSLIREGLFADAYYIFRLLVERGNEKPDTLGDLIDTAYRADMLDACADFLAAIAFDRPAGADLLNYAAGLLGSANRKGESRFFAEKAAAVRPFFPSTTTKAKLNLLVLQCAGNGDYRYSPYSKRFFMPGISDLYTLLDPHIASHRLLVDDLPAALRALESLPACDLVFNAISDPDYETSLHNAAEVCEHAQLPIFNLPGRVRALNRESLPGLVNGCAGVMAARSVFLKPDRTHRIDVISAIREHHLEYPVIIRAPGFQGGRHMALIREAAELNDEIFRGNGLYVIEYIDVARPDDRAPGVALYPKYRAFYVHGTLFPMHLFFSDQYEVHKKTSDPVHARYPRLAELEADFLENPAHHLPAGTWQELAVAMKHLGLDYFGVDFAVSARPQDKGKLVLFECNPSMRNWLTLLPEGDPVQRKWREVTLAACAAMCEKSGVTPWNFTLKTGK